jgi:hypothetical protein
MALGIQWVSGKDLTGFIFLIGEDPTLKFFTSFKVFATLLTLVFWSIAVYGFLKANKSNR